MIEGEVVEIEIDKPVQGSVSKTVCSPRQYLVNSLDHVSCHVFVACLHDHAFGFRDGSP